MGTGSSSGEAYDAGKLARSLVGGYIRQHSDDTDIHIPKDVELLCVQFYALPIDQWREEYIQIENCVDDDRKLLIAQKKNITAFGTCIVSRGMKFRWKLKINHFEGGMRFPNIVIGIMNYQDLADHMNNSPRMFHCEKRGYGIDITTGLKTNNGKTKYYFHDAKQARAGHIFTVNIDFTHWQFGKLSYKMGKKSLGVAFDKIEIENNESYVLAVGIKNKGDNILIVE